MQKVFAILGRSLLAPVVVPGLATSLFIRPLSISEGVDLLTGDQMKQGFAWARRFLAASVVDAEGKPVMTAEEWDQWPTTEIEIFNAIVDAALTANGLKNTPGEVLADAGNESSPTP